MLIVVGILFGGIFLWKLFGAFMLKRYMANNQQIATVSTIKVDNALWQPTLKAIGSLRATKGVNVTTELAGMVQKIYFTGGTIVNENTVLIQLNADAEIGQLQSLQAQAALAEITYLRDKAQYQAHAVSKQTVEADFQNWKSLQGQVRQQTAIVEKKTIRAPFTGRLGINYVNPGQYVNPGEKIVTLQTLNPIYIDFNMPQQTLTQLKVGQKVRIISDTFKGQVFHGKVTTIDPLIDTTTRNVQVEATIDNPHHQLIPGMFATVEVDTNTPKSYLTVPQTAVSFNSYGNIVYLIEKKENTSKEKPVLIAKQVFVTTGEMRGDQITLLKGVKKGDTIVTSGQLKLKNGSQVAINNSVMPPNNATSDVPNEH